MPTPSQSSDGDQNQGPGRDRPRPSSREGGMLSESELTLDAAMRGLEDRGYKGQLHPEGDELRFAGDRRGFHASEFIVEGQVRTESDSTLEYSALVLALRHLPSGRAGTLVAPFGTTDDGAATHAVELLEELDEHAEGPKTRAAEGPRRNGGTSRGGR